MNYYYVTTGSDARHTNAWLLWREDEQWRLLFDPLCPGYGVHQREVVATTLAACEELGYSVGPNYSPVPHLRCAECDEPAYYDYLCRRCRT
jgi:hypothetical protein